MRPRLVLIDSSEGGRAMTSVLGGGGVDASVFSAVARLLGAAGFTGRMYGLSGFGRQGRRLAEVHPGMIPIIFTTAHDAPSTRERARRSGPIGQAVGRP